MAGLADGTTPFSALYGKEADFYLDVQGCSGISKDQTLLGGHWQAGVIEDRISSPSTAVYARDRTSYVFGQNKAVCMSRTVLLR